MSRFGPFWTKLVAIVAVVLLCKSRPGDGLKCFACSYQFNELLLDYECVVNPGEVKTGDHIQDCDDGRVCYTHVRRLVYSRNTVQSMHRSCDVPVPDEQLGCTIEEGGSKETCRMQCSTDYCNHESGQEESTDGENGQGGIRYQGVFSNPIDKSGWYPVWVTNGGITVKSHHFMAIITTLCAYLLYVK